LVVTKTSHRTAAMLGISLDAIGYIGLAYSHTMTAMILTYSIISGKVNILIIIYNIITVIN